MENLNSFIIYLILTTEPMDEESEPNVWYEDLN